MHKPHGRICTKRSWYTHSELTAPSGCGKQNVKECKRYCQRPLYQIIRCAMVAIGLELWCLGKMPQWLVVTWLLPIVLLKVAMYESILVCKRPKNRPIGLPSTPSLSSSLGHNGPTVAFHPLFYGNLAAKCPTCDPIQHI